MRPNDSLLTFWKRVSFGPGCWEWKGGHTKDGYGTWRSRGKQLYAHRVSYQFWKGPIPAGLIVRHRCDNPGCVSPFHLEAGTHQQNHQDMVDRGRARHGVSHGRLSDDTIREIRRRRMYGNKLQDIADTQGLAVSAVWNICHRFTYKNVA